MRNRILKEGFFRNYELAQLPPLARILFEGLWLMADKEGRLWDRPQQIKAEVLPYDDCNADDLLAQLANSNFIFRYESQGKKCIEVANFSKHQTLTTWEKTNLTSDIPARCMKRRASKVQQTDNRTSTEEQQTDDCRTSEISISIPEQTEDKPHGTEHRALMGHLDERFGKIPDGKAQAGAVKWLLANGYSVSQCRECMDWLVAQEWRTTRVSWLTVKKEIGAWKARTNGSVSQIGKPCEDDSILNPPQLSEEEMTAELRRSIH